RATAARRGSRPGACRPSSAPRRSELPGPAPPATPRRAAVPAGRAGASFATSGSRSPRVLLLDPHVVEADALGLLVETLRAGANRAKPEQIAVPDHRHLFVELPRLLLPERHALLGIGLAGQLGLELQDVLVGRPARPARREKDGVGRIVDGTDAGGERVVILGVVPPLHQGSPVDHL